MHKTDVFGINYNNLTFQEAVNTVKDYLQGKSKKSVFFLNADYLYKALHDEEYAKILNSAELVLPDGVYLRLLSASLGTESRGNCNGSDLTPVVLVTAAFGGNKVFLLGSKEEIVKKAGDNLVKAYPGLKIVGAHPGYFSDDAAVIEEINRSGADILIVGMGAPLQEKWINKHRDQLNPRLCLGVGGWMDYPGGRLKRAPVLLRKLNLEWTWRIAQDPQLMLGRYAKSGLFLLGLLIKSYFMGKRHSVGVQQRDRALVLNVSYDNLYFKEAVNIAEDILGNGENKSSAKRTIFFLNADCLYKAQKDEAYRGILNGKDLVLPDGIGLGVVSSLLGIRMLDNCNGTEFSPAVLRVAANRGLAVFLLGGKEGVARKAAEMATNRFPGLKVAGVCNGFFANDDDVVEQVNNSGADILLVGMGAPLQEKWIHKHRAALKPRLCMGVGAYLDFLSGYVRRAPKIMIAIHLEWLWRVFMEPRRMFKRYFIDGAKLFGMVLRYKMRKGVLKC
ncbi:MAG TPA: WecB/TagA/CpsF family glycosyltransferase [Candidatus Omnitrophota bacterium]|nr:WecB/TagA/CpsF family glycosyltransferase [Candidatus Omnitrophota bacterium]HRZ14103.1 WecB/TagA/CpsF family glycosyltransferase [Candidatus Omnitrophota bacterium]